MKMKHYTFLALGDSYTVGEQVRLAESFPYQAVQLLRKALSSLGNGLQFMAPEIVATTGLTTQELTEAIDKAVLLPKYDFVTLLIGVNNQYRGLPLNEFRNEFTGLLERAIAFAGGSHDCVYVLSIPDWGVTSYAKERDTAAIGKEIDAYNRACKEVAQQHKVQFIDITAMQRKDAKHKDFMAADGLHPSGKEYAKWAALLSEKILNCIS